MRQVSPGFVLTAFFAVLIGLGVAFVVKRSLETKPEPVVDKPKPPPMQIVILASSDLPADRILRNGDVVSFPLTREEFAKRKWPVMFGDARQLIGRTLKTPLKRGQPFALDCVYPEGTGPDLAEKIPPGLRAVTLNEMTEGAIPTGALPGSLVDIYFRTTPNEDTKPKIPEVTRLLVERAQILAIEAPPGSVPTAADKKKAYPDTVTLAVTPEQAMQLRVVQGRGELSLALRQPEDASTLANGGDLTLEELLNLPPEVEPVPPPKPPEPFVAEIYRKGRRQTMKFAVDGGVIQDSGVPDIDPAPNSNPPASGNPADHPPALTPAARRSQAPVAPTEVEDFDPAADDADGTDEEAALQAPGKPINKAGPPPPRTRPARVSRQGVRQQTTIGVA